MQSDGSESFSDGRGVIMPNSDERGVIMSNSDGRGVKIPNSSPNHSC
jgi:hypothetical protein